MVDFQAVEPPAIVVTASRAEETDWKEIVGLYDTLMVLRQSPVVALNRAIAVAQSEGAERGLEEIQAIAGAACLEDYPFYHAALGELEHRCHRHQRARQHFQVALSHARNPMEQRFLRQRIDACASHDPDLQ